MLCAYTFQGEWPKLLPLFSDSSKYFQSVSWTFKAGIVFPSSHTFPTEILYNSAFKIAENQRNPMLSLFPQTNLSGKLDWESRTITWTWLICWLLTLPLIDLPVYSLFCRDGLLLYSPGWPWIHHSPASAFQVFGVYITLVPHSHELTETSGHCRARSIREYLISLHADGHLRSCCNHVYGIHPLVLSP